MKVVIAGAGGRMGQILLEALADAHDLSLHGALDRTGSPELGRIVGGSAERPCLISDRVDDALAGAQICIDFTRPEATLGHLEACVRHGVGMVIGTTGFNTEGKAAITAAARHIPIVFAPNMSVGVNLLLKLLDTAARVLGEGYDVEILEAHHRHKVDAPSGTALALGGAVAAAQGRDLAECAIYGREGLTGERPTGAIGFATIRGGDIVGDHTVLFAGTGERVEITHKASSRHTFALGALRAARFLSDRPAGLYDMQDVLGLK